MRYIVDRPGTLYLGKQGEHLARELAFTEPAAWESSCGTGAVQLLYRPPGGAPSYPVVLEREEGTYLWHITSADTAREGYGRCELRYSVGNVVIRSVTYVTLVADGVGAAGPQDPYLNYLEQVARVGAEALAAAARAEGAALHPPTIQDGNWWLWNPETGAYEDAGVPASGDKAMSDHRYMSHLDEVDQHPLDAITGLRSAIARIPAPVEAITNLEMEELLK